MAYRALALTLNKLDKLTSKDTKKIEILNQSIEHSCQGVFPLKNNEFAYTVNNKSADVIGVLKPTDFYRTSNQIILKKWHNFLSSDS